MGNIDYFLWGGEKNKQLNAGRKTGHGQNPAAQWSSGHGYAAGVAGAARAGVLCTPVVCFTNDFGESSVERGAQAPREALPRAASAKRSRCAAESSTLFISFVI